MSKIIITGLDEDFAKKLENEAKKYNTSVNQFVISLIKKGLEKENTSEKNEYHDLDDLAGTWDEEEYSMFLENTKQFDTIDKDLW